MADDRAELERLREIDRMHELEAKASGVPAQAPADPGEEPLRGGTMRSIIDLLRPGMTAGVGHGAVKAATFGNIDPTTASDDPIGKDVGEYGVKGLQAYLTGGLTSAPASAVGRVGMSALLNGAQGALQKPQGEDGLFERAKAGGISGLLGAASQGVGEVAGKAGDYLMQKAAGMKKYLPGAGKQLAEEGVIGTKGMMRDQVESALSGREAELKAAVGKMQGQIKPDDVADSILKMGDGYMPPAGVRIPSENEPFVDAVNSRAQEALQRGALSPSQALDTSRAIAKPAYNPATGDALGAFKHKISQTEAGSLKEALKGAAEQQGLPEVRDLLAREATLINAKRGLGKPENLSAVLGKTALKAIVGGGLGYELGGKEGAAAGAVLGTPLGQSATGRAAIGASKAIPYATPMLLDLLRNKDEVK